MFWGMNSQKSQRYQGFWLSSPYRSDIAANNHVKYVLQLYIGYIFSYTSQLLSVRRIKKDFPPDPQRMGTMKVGMWAKIMLFCKQDR